MSRDRIDTHHHLVPDFYREWMDAKGLDAGGLPVPDWDVQTDSALASSGVALPSTLAWAQPDHLTFGCDFPYAGPEVVAVFTAMLDGNDAVDHAAVDRDNAAQLFPRFGRPGVQLRSRGD